MLLDELSDGDICKLWDLSGVVCANTASTGSTVPAFLREAPWG
jgi:hypothetical protein